MKVAVGLSGGVDSAVAALLLKRAGHEVVGVTMKLWREGIFRGGGHNACFGPGEAESMAAAEALAKRIGIDYHVFDCSEEFIREVLGYFRAERGACRTPNPCVVCNKRVKFGYFPETVFRTLGVDRFATGHYARIVGKGDRLAVARGKDIRKDQSYFLWGLSQEQLSHVVFPFENLSKSDVREIARKEGLPMAETADSQDFYSGDLNELVGAEDSPGNVVSTDGKVLGRHNGFWHYTIGQRKGIGIAAREPLYVVGISKDRNEVVVGSHAEAISAELYVKDINWMAADPSAARVEGAVKIRSTGEPKGPAVYENGVISVEGGLFAVAPGQSAVMYAPSGEILLGGVICARDAE